MEAHEYHRSIPDYDRTNPATNSEKNLKRYEVKKPTGEWVATNNDAWKAHKAKGGEARVLTKCIVWAEVDEGKLLGMPYPPNHRYGLP